MKLWGLSLVSNVPLSLIIETTVKYIPNKFTYVFVILICDLVDITVYYATDSHIPSSSVLYHRYTNI